MKHEQIIAELLRPEKKQSMRYRDLPGFIRYNINIGMIAMALYNGAKYHQTVMRVADYLINHNVTVEAGYFKDPRGLELHFPINASGHRESYIVHTQSGKKVAIMYDMLPPNKYVCETLEERMKAGKDSNLGSMVRKIIK